MKFAIAFVILSGLVFNAHLYHPDAENGHYRATRFDWSGIISSFENDGHNYLGQWFKKYSPTIHDAIMGPVESFSPLNYDETDPGGNFVQIGVGVLTKPDEKKYNAFNLYPMVNQVKWKTTKETDKVQSTQVPNDDNYSYVYTKTV